MDVEIMYSATENGVEKRIESWQIIIPLADNQQQPFPEEIIERIKSQIISEFGGLTSFNVIGYWKSGEKLYLDNDIVIIIDVPVKYHGAASTFFMELKDELMKELRQEKIYITMENEKSELLSSNEFLQELGFEVVSGQKQPLTQDNIEKLIKESNIVNRRLSYKTLNLIRDEKSQKIIWEREILGIKIETKIDDNYPHDAVILSADSLEKYFSEELFGKNIIIIGDYEYQSYILDKEKRRYVIGAPQKFSKYDKGDEEPLYYHDLHGLLRTSEFIPNFAEQIFVNYIILRENGVSKDKIMINVGPDGSMQAGEPYLLRCPAIIPYTETQEAILDYVKKAADTYENGSIDEIALMQAKVMNIYNEKTALVKNHHRR